MKINELTGYKNNEIYNKAKDIFGSDIRGKPIYVSLDEWQALMHQYGFNHLGTGNYGSVYEKPGYPWVFKLFTYDDAYYAFLQYVRKNQNNPNLPKMKGNIIKINDNTFAVRMEKLSEVSKNNFYEYQAALYTMAEVIQYDINVKDMDQEERDTIKQYPGFLKFITDWVRNSMINKYELDIHEGNIMMRGNVPVLIDPLTL